jgi:hypothetical protein
MRIYEGCSRFTRNFIPRKAVRKGGGVKFCAVTAVVTPERMMLQHHKLTPGVEEVI